jgi:hypothetical protein
MNTSYVNAREEHLHLRATARSAVQVSLPLQKGFLIGAEILQRLHLPLYWKI